MQSIPPHADSKQSPAMESLRGLLSEVQKKGTLFGPGRARRLPRRELTFILRNLATLIENGLSLPKALGTLARERTLRKFSNLLETLQKKIEAGETFSNALAGYPQYFNSIMVNQVRVGERSGTVADALGRLAAQLDRGDKIRGQVTKKLAYPAVLLVAGAASVTFMLLFVIPVFEATYAESNVPLPMITRALIQVGRYLSSWGWIVLLLLITAVVAVRQFRKQEHLAFAMDKLVLRLPLFGPWLRDLSVFQFMDVLHNMLVSGFTVVEALRMTAPSIGNRAVRKSVEQLQQAVTRGERFSRELDRQGDLFPPVVSQLVIVGESTGNLAKATGDIREHLGAQIERTTSIMVGTIEPVLTIAMAAAIGGILLAIYLPMFDMIGAMNPQ